MEAAGIRSRWLVAADGLHSPTRQALGLDRPVSAPPRYGLRRHYRVAPWSDVVEVHWSTEAEAYITPVAPDVVGVALLGPRGTGFERVLRGFPEVLRRLDGAPPVSPVRGAGPLRRTAARRVHGRVLLVGDASGYVDAHREGIRSARPAPGRAGGQWRPATRRRTSVPVAGHPAVPGPDPVAVGRGPARPGRAIARVRSGFHQCSRGSSTTSWRRRSPYRGARRPRRLGA